MQLMQLRAWGRMQCFRSQGLIGSVCKMATNFKEAARKVPRPSKLWNPFGFSVMPRRFPRQRRGSKRQPTVPLKEWKIIRGDTVSNKRPSISLVMDADRSNCRIPCHFKGASLKSVDTWIRSAEDHPFPRSNLSVV